MKYPFAILLALAIGCVAADAGKKVGRRISGKYPDKGFQQKIEQPKSTPTPSRPYYPYGKEIGILMPTHPPLLLADYDDGRHWRHDDWRWRRHDDHDDWRWHRRHRHNVIVVPFGFTMPTHPPQIDLAFNMPTHPPCV